MALGLTTALLSAYVLLHYKCDAPTRLAADASSSGLGGVLLQEDNGIWKPVAYASRSLTPVEGRYAAIEKEALAIAWVCEQFSQYIIGKEFTIQTDHKPLISLLKHRRLDELPLRVQCFCIRLLHFLYDIVYVLGKT